jgi:hypothetical protein
MMALATIANLFSFFLNRKSDSGAQPLTDNSLKDFDTVISDGIDLVVDPKGDEIDSNIDRESVKNMTTTLKDDYLVIILSLPFVLSLIPQTRNFVIDGFVVIQQLPTWYHIIFGLVIISTFGLRSFISSKFYSLMKIIKTPK